MDPGPIRPVAGHCVEGVANGHDASFERNCLTDETVGIAFAVITFVVIKNGREDVAQVFQIVKDGPSFVGVAADCRRFETSIRIGS